MVVLFLFFSFLVFLLFISCGLVCIHAAEGRGPTGEAELGVISPEAQTLGQVLQVTVPEGLAPPGWGWSSQSATQVTHLRCVAQNPGALKLHFFIAVCIFIYFNS